MTSELALSAPHLVICIYTSTNDQALSATCHPRQVADIRRRQKLNAKCSMHFVFQHYKDKVWLLNSDK